MFHLSTQWHLTIYLKHLSDRTQIQTLVSLMSLCKIVAQKGCEMNRIGIAYIILLKQTLPPGNNKTSAIYLQYHN